MAAPNLKDYFYSAQIKPLINLCNKDYQARWKDIELSLIKDPPVYKTIGNSDIGKLQNKVQNPWIKSQLKIWISAKEEYNLPDKLKIRRWCAYDPDLQPNQMDTIFKKLDNQTDYNILLNHR